MYNNNFCRTIVHFDFKNFIFPFDISPEIRKAWENRKTITTNLNDIGLGYDPNKVIKIPNAKQQRLQMVKLINGFVEEDNDKLNPSIGNQQRAKGFVMEEMEATANALRESNFR